MVEQEGVVAARVAEHRAAVALAAVALVAVVGAVKDLEPEGVEVVVVHLEWVVGSVGGEEETMAPEVITDLAGVEEGTMAPGVITGLAATTGRVETMGWAAMEEVLVVLAVEREEAEPGFSLRKQDLGPPRISNPWESMKLNPVSFRSTECLS